MTSAPTHPNWARNLLFTPAHIHHPRSVEELCELVAASHKCKVVGSGHSFNHIADTPGGDLIILDRMEDEPPQLDKRTGLLWVPGRYTYGQVVDFLRGSNWDLHNLASLPHITVAGSITTATHGSGVGIGNLATCVTALQLVNAQGEVVTVSRQRNPDVFPAYPVSLGALGIITRVQVQLVPAFEVKQFVYEGLAVREAVTHLEEILAAGYSVSLFSTWQEPVFTQVWRKIRADDVPDGTSLPTVWHGATLARHQLHPCGRLGAEACSVQLGVRGPSGDRLAHFKLEFQPSLGDELQSEYILDASAARAAIAVLARLHKEISPILHVFELRTIAADDIWLSMNYKKDSVGLHFTWKKNWPAVKKFLPTLEKALEPLGARPHWGKLTCITTEDRLRKKYPKWDDWKKVRAKVDPTGKFLNPWLQEVLGLPRSTM